MIVSTVKKSEPGESVDADDERTKDRRRMGKSHEEGKRERGEKRKERTTGGEDVYVYQSVWTELEKVTN